MSVLEINDRRRTFARLADILIPESGGLPAASDAGVHEGLIDAALNYRPDLIEAFAHALDLAAEDDPVTSISRLAADHPQEFFALSLLATGSYYLSPSVRQALNYHQGQPRPAHDDVETYVDMLEAVVERGPLYRSIE